MNEKTIKYVMSLENDFTNSKSPKVKALIKNLSVKHCSHNKIEPDCIDFPKCVYNDFVGNYINV